MTRLVIVSAVAMCAGIVLAAPFWLARRNGVTYWMAGVGLTSLFCGLAGVAAFIVWRAFDLAAS